MALTLDVLCEYDVEMMQLINAIAPANFLVTHAAVLNGLIGRTAARGIGHYNQWRTVAPYLASLVCFVLTGQPYAPGNQHVVNTPHAVGGNTNFGLNVTQQTLDELIEVVRSLFTFPDVQQNGHAIYTKHLAARDGANNRTYLIKVRWTHGAAADDIVVNVKSFNVAPAVQQVNIAALTAQFQALGF